MCAPLCTFPKRIKKECFFGQKILVKKQEKGLRKKASYCILK